MRYKAFISYGRADQTVAKALRSGLRSFVAPFWSRAGGIFLSWEGFQASPAHRPRIADALNQSEYFILLASPAAAHSEWVKAEINAWLERNGLAPDRLVIILTDGEIAWDPTSGDFDWTKTTALPPLMGKLFTEEPMYIDLRWARTSGDLTLRNPRFKDAVVNVSDALKGGAGAGLAGGDRRQRTGVLNLLGRISSVFRRLFGAPEETGDAPPAEVEKVLLGASAPEAVKPGDEFTARFSAYIKALEDSVKLQFERLGPGARSITGVSAAGWQRGTRVKVVLGGNHLLVSPTAQEFVWEAESNLLEFDVKVPPDAPECLTVLKFDVSISEIVVARLRLDLTIKSNTDTRREHAVEAEPARSAFASYATEDRLRVLDRVSEVRRNGVDIFLDCLSLHPGDKWKPRLEQEIKRRELFLLFWSIHAKESEWVTWEWHVALKHKGLSGIDPHPLDPTFEAEPPEELRELHFGDPFMLVRKAFEKPPP
ncbi:MAG TPA: toll/interleukin-1 receptor domain-containing protein [Pyrinomonadaceae bacterium]